MSGEVLESLQLIHTRLSKLEEGKKPVVGALETAREVPRWLRQHYEWTMLQHEMDTHVRMLGADYRVTRDQLAEMNRKYNQYWEEITGVNPKFRFGASQFKYITVAEAALKRNELIQKYIGVDHPCVCEPFVGSGADLNSMLFNMRPRMMYAIDSMGAPEDGRFTYASALRPERAALGAEDEDEAGPRGQPGRARGRGFTENNPFDYLKRNVLNFEEAYPRTKESQVVIFNGNARQFFETAHEFKEVEGNVVPVHIDLLFLDPPWTLAGRVNEATPDELVDYLHEEVLTPMFAQKLRPKVIVLKSRFQWEDMRRLMGRIDGYMHLNTIQFAPFRREVAFHVLTTSDYDVIELVWSKLYNHINKGGEAPSEPKGSVKRAEGFGEFRFKQRGRQ